MSDEPELPEVPDHRPRRSASGPAAPDVRQQIYELTSALTRREIDGLIRDLRHMRGTRRED